MDLTKLCAVALLALALALALTASAEAQQQDQWQLPDCWELEADSLEAALLQCGQERAAEGPGLAVDPSEEAVDPARVRWLSAEMSIEPARSADGSLHIEIDGATVLISREGLSSRRDVPEQAVGANSEILIVGSEIREQPHGRADQEEAVQILEIPNGHLPPPGTCRAWFPDRSAEQQPPPATCGLQVPEGAVLIRG